MNRHWLIGAVCFFIIGIALICYGLSTSGWSAATTLGMIFLVLAIVYFNESNKI